MLYMNLNHVASGQTQVAIKYCSNLKKRIMNSPKNHGVSVSDVWTTNSFNFYLAVGSMMSMN